MSCERRWSLKKYSMLETCMITSGYFSPPPPCTFPRSASPCRTDHCQLFTSPVWRSTFGRLLKCWPFTLGTAALFIDQDWQNFWWSKIVINWVCKNVWPFLGFEFAYRTYFTKTVKYRQWTFTLCKAYTKSCAVDNLFSDSIIFQDNKSM